VETKDTPTKIRLTKYIAAQSLLHVPIRLSYQQEVVEIHGSLSDVRSVKLCFRGSSGPLRRHAVASTFIDCFLTDNVCDWLVASLKL
jgi:hypothetical protein